MSYHITRETVGSFEANDDLGPGTLWAVLEVVHLVLGVGHLQREYGIGLSFFFQITFCFFYYYAWSCRH